MTTMTLATGSRDYHWLRNAKFDSLGALRDWVEHGKAPSGLTALDGNPGPTAGRTRPLCEFPKWPKFTGAAGTENVASSFTCVER